MFFLELIGLIYNGMGNLFYRTLMGFSRYLFLRLDALNSLYIRTSFLVLRELAA